VSLLLGSSWLRVASRLGPCIEPGPSTAGHVSSLDSAGTATGCHETCGGLGPGCSRGPGSNEAGHVAALGLVLAKRATPVVVDSVLALGLSQYLRVPIHCGTGSGVRAHCK
jgi:hypothetical protein